MDGSRPEICDGNSTVRVFRVERREFLFSLFFDLLAELSELVGEFGSALGDFLQHCAEDETGDGVEVAGESVTSDSESFQRNASTTGEWVGNEELVFAVGGLDQLSGNVYVSAVVCVVPVCELTDEMKKGFAESEIIGVFGKTEGGCPEFSEDVSGAVFELRGAVVVSGIGEENGEEHCAT